MISVKASGVRRLVGPTGSKGIWERAVEEAVLVKERNPARAVELDRRLLAVRPTNSVLETLSETWPSWSHAVPSTLA